MCQFRLIPTFDGEVRRAAVQINFQLSPHKFPRSTARFVLLQRATLCRLELISGEQFLPIDIVKLTWEENSNPPLSKHILRVEFSLFSNFISFICSFVTSPLSTPPTHVDRLISSLTLLQESRRSALLKHIWWISWGGTSARIEGRGRP